MLLRFNVFRYKLISSYITAVLWSEKFLKTHYTTRSCCACKILLVYIFRVIAIHIGYTRPFKIRSMLIELRNWTPPHKAFGGWWFLFRFPFSFVPPENKSRVVGLLCFKKHSTLLPHSKQYHIAFIMTSFIQSTNFIFNDDRWWWWWRTRAPPPAPTCTCMRHDSSRFYYIHAWYMYM